MKFTSQICTTKEQSERLLALGLKRETADMHHFQHTEGRWNIEAIPPIGYTNRLVPAWSLHRLMEIGNFVHIALLDVNKAYKSCIDNIEEKIRFGFINKEYLVEKQ